MKRYSIIVVNLNNVSGLERTLSSISSQTVSDREVIVIDGGSSDGSVRTVKSFGNLVDNFHSGPDSGIYNAMNKGLAFATGMYVVYMNSGDCFFDEHSLEKVNSLEGDIILGGSVYGGGRRFPPKEISIYNLLSTGICHQSTYYRRDVLSRYPFDESYKVVADLKTVVEPYAKEHILITVCDDILSLCEGNGLSQKRWRDIRKETERIVDDCIEPFHIRDYKKLVGISPAMLDDFAVISHFSSLIPVVRFLRKVSVLYNSLFKKIPLD